jgi:hypothetical protein
MLIAIWDFLFTRRKWIIVETYPLFGETYEGTKGCIGNVYVLQDQFGNIKKKEVTS